MEIWAAVPGTTHLEVSTHGRARSVARTVIDINGKQRRYRSNMRKMSVNPRGGHLQLGKDGFVHRLVARTFIGPCPPGLEVRHKDGDPTNNHVDNLEYGTRAQNMQDRVKHGNNPHINKTHCPRNHPLEEPNLVSETRFKKKGRTYRSCLACSRAYYVLEKFPDLTLKEASDIAYQRLVDKNVHSRTWELPSIT